MKVKLLHSALLSVILFFTGCVKEGNMQLMSGPEAKLSLNIHTQAVGSGKGEIQNVRVVSFVPADASKVAGWMEVNSGSLPLESNPITRTLRTGVRDVYVFTNEDKELTDKLNSMRSLTDLQAIQLPYSETLAPPFLGSYVHPKLDIKTEESKQIDAKVVRTVSKVNLTLSYVWGAGKPLSEELVIEKVQVKHLPKYSYLVGKNYDGDEFVDSNILEGATLDNKSPTPNEEYKSDNLIIYIPEFLGASADNKAFIEIMGSLKSSSATKCQYTIPLGDGMASSPMNNYNITRNTAFQIDATIKSYGLKDDISAEVIVSPWSMVNQDEDAGWYINFKTATAAADDTHTPIADGANLDERTEILNITCSTNIGGWYAVARDMNGTFIHRSEFSSPIPDDPGIYTQTVRVTIPKYSVQTPFGQKYTVSIYHPPLIADESVGPIRSLTFTQKGGVIPSSVLRQPFTIKYGDNTSVSCAGWPEDKLPKNGLQIAMRGNVIPPGPREGAKEKQTMWGTKESDSSQSTSIEVGAGESNYKMISEVIDPSPNRVGNMCKDLGPEWYVPSRNELLLIYNYVPELGASYTFLEGDNWDNGYYWSSSPHWYVTFANGRATNMYNGIKYFVRCVRNV